MATPINQQPGGILGLLGIKNGGRNPDQLSTLLAGVFDLSPYYLEQNAQYLQVLADAQLGLNIFAQVPQGEVWYVHHASFATGELAAANYMEAMLAVSTASNLDWVGISDAVRAAPTECCAGVLQRPFVLGPGNQLCRYDLRVVTATTIPTLSAVRYTPMQM